MTNPLTEQQRWTLSLAAQGLTVSEIATRTGRPISDIRMDMQQSLDVLGASSKLHAIVIALRNDWIIQ